MNYKVEAYTRKGSNEFNEDALVRNESARIFGVIDGVSSIDKYRNRRGETGGYIASRLLKQSLENIKQCEDLEKAVERGNELIQREMEDARIDTGHKENRWGAALALVKLNEGKIEYVQSGDCMILAVYKNNHVRPLTVSQVGHLEERSLNRWKEGIGKGMKTASELLDYTRDVLRENRTKSNTLEGYGVLNGEEEAVSFLEYGKINAYQIRYLIILSDGLFLPAKEREPAEDWERTVSIISEKGLERYARWIEEMEEADPECTRYIRLKKSDDKTGMVISLNQR
ncbi:protein phosphatase 2C domain-containing protein [Pseudalkalibacillus caeni]|uniref:Protein phosphatase 2C domain-containing protein n=1 Tax=Exobacillus caeni TaxID=2574798 RepID=A0A5R9F7H5_9BACL|nr:protein phosphatase 2C domain-containing protein [Pseudalkalibacillus caeni]TLS38210.1 protein phosphatase 2C domain-containing protein [Pseudalkalibacillus caeni]